VSVLSLSLDDCLVLPYLLLCLGSIAGSPTSGSCLAQWSGWKIYFVWKVQLLANWEKCKQSESQIQEMGLIIDSTSLSRRENNALVFWSSVTIMNSGNGDLRGGALQCYDWQILRHCWQLWWSLTTERSPVLPPQPPKAIRLLRWLHCERYVWLRRRIKTNRDHATLLALPPGWFCSFCRMRLTLTFTDKHSYVHRYLAIFEGFSGNLPGQSPCILAFPASLWKSFSYDDNLIDIHELSECNWNDE